ncbi:MAG: phosphonate metabolism protein/1,5-bisphosphokinase (PRPP-forming) PhnN [Halothiobacillaceae bacterium]|nr:phosphonate metabolism protein/1,5-bisphosphokinase (PRPP-forming) PhnN [Halothiobacillaceae bacterium]
MSGTLFYVIGASGAGKDSLLRGARAQLATENVMGKNVIFAHRYITRPVELAGENHIALSPQEFHARQAAGLFAMHWHSHELDYGLGIEINLWLERGLNVVMNGSRAYLDEAARLYPHNLVPVLVRVAPAVLRARLQARGRETPAQIEERLAGALAFENLSHPRLAILQNDGELAHATAQLVEVLRT